MTGAKVMINYEPSDEECDAHDQLLAAFERLNPTSSEDDVEQASKGIKWMIAQLSEFGFVVMRKVLQ